MNTRQLTLLCLLTASLATPELSAKPYENSAGNREYAANNTHAAKAKGHGYTNSGKNIVMTAHGDTLVTYPAADGAEMKTDFTVCVRTKDGQWQQLPTYAVKVDRVTDGRHHVELASMTYFDFAGTAEVSVTAHNRQTDGVGQTTDTDVRVRPASYGIKTHTDGNTVTFTLDHPRNISVEFGGDIFHNLHLFANPIDRRDPLMQSSKNKKNISGRKQPRHHKDLIYFGPGIHRLPGDTMRIASGQTVYIAGGAVVRGCLKVIDAHDVKILGRGEVHPEGRGEGIHIGRSKHVEVEGIITTQCPTGGSDSVTIRNVKSISSYGWGDGLNVFASNNVLYDGVFCRNSDDCTTVYATRKGYTGGCRNIRMQNSTLWADVAHPIFIGLHGNVEHPDTIENVSYDNIDILDHKEMQLDYQGCMAINAGDNNLVRGVRFENIRVENFRQGQLVNLRIFYNKKYCGAPGRGIEDVCFRNISYDGTHAEPSIIAGYDSQRTVKNIRFENLRINGKLIYDDMPEKLKWHKTADMARFFIGEHTDSITFIATEK